MARRAEPRRAAGSRPTGPGVWLDWHWRAILATVRDLIAAPGGTFLTAAVIGVALALPAGLYTVLENARSVTGTLDRSAELSLFLVPTLPPERAEDLRARLLERGEILAVRLITPEEARAEYRQAVGQEDPLAALGGENPLPAVLVVSPASGVSTPEAAARLAAELDALPEVEQAQYDLEWVRRLGGILALLERALGVVAGLFALGVVVIVGNTVRLGIDNRRDHIEVARLCGATDAFVRRPFLWSGALQGMVGGMVAVVLVAACLLALQGPVERLAALYASGFRLTLPGLGPSLAVLGAGALLGWLGSWLAVGRHLRALEPT